MYLKSIEIQGFKSFANKLRLDFDTGITGIVGPNGSGKSNVADAVRWVLGEQSAKQLRGTAMQDIIFSGTEQRKPQGFAAVSVTLDNSGRELTLDYDEITVSRRLYRSGESEYRINGSACRLKDINELFYDTGIGKEGYSIIGQGQVDLILSTKPEDRRELFDEAAGIVKFKRRKAEALKKLGRERENLARAQDILKELEKRVGPLKRQSDAAKEYLKLKEALKVCDANLFLLRLSGIETQQKELKERESLLKGHMGELDALLEELKEAYGALGVKQKEADSRMGETTAAFSGAALEKESLEGQVNVLSEQIRTQQVDEAHIRSRMEAIGRERGEREESLLGLKKQEEELTALKESLAAALCSAREAYEERDAHIRVLEEDIGRAREDLIGVLNEKASLAESRQSVKMRLEQVRERSLTVSDRISGLKNEEPDRQKALKREEEALESLKASLNQVCAQWEGQEETCARMEEEIRQLNIQIGEKRQDYHRAQAKYESMRNLAERYEGYGNSIRRVMELKEKVAGIHGVVADLITTKKDYETAIEIALGGSIQNIVTDDEAVAQELIAYLKQNRYGRATFLPLTAMGHAASLKEPGALKEKGVLGVAQSLVEVKPCYRGLAAHLLGRTLVVDTIDHASALARKYRYSLRIVTLEGELLSPGGSMTGGSFKNASNLLGRKRELEGLLKLRDMLEAQTQALEKTYKDSQEALLKARKIHKSLGEKRQELTLLENAAALTLSRHREEGEKAAQEAVELSCECGQLKSKEKALLESLKELSGREEALLEAASSAKRIAEERSAALDEAKQDLKSLEDALSQEKVKEAALDQKSDFIRENKARIDGELKELEEEEKALTESLQARAGGISEKEEQIRKKREEIAGLKERMTSLSEKNEVLAGERETLQAGMEENLVKREETLQTRSALDKDLLRVQSQTEKLEEKLEEYTSALWSEYELTPSSARDYLREQYRQPGQAKKQADTLKAQIRSLGDIHVGAIEEYKEVSSRYELMRGQVDDMALAEKQLEGIIKELDGAMRRQFEDKFGEISEGFDRVFRELFGGGRGTLKLVEDEDILEAGITVIAQPPGKKLQNMMQLSGGEKALTAIALLFAIQAMKPSPFCLLDEIEAALDDSNVGRFAAYLKQLAGRTQFIIITHRHGTMAAADRLYGITMQEKGVSSLVSVSLVESALD